MRPDWLLVQTQTGPEVVPEPGTDPREARGLTLRGTEGTSPGLQGDAGLRWGRPPARQEQGESGKKNLNNLHQGTEQ